MNSPEPLVAIDFFAGCGGLTAGLKRAGFDVRAAVEINEDASDTYEANHPEVALFKDIQDVRPDQLIEACGGQKISLIAGCAPCQGFCSLTVKRGRKDPRNKLLLHMADLIAQLKPEAVMMENVPGLAKRGKAIFTQFVEKLETLGYKVNFAHRKAWQIAQMADYGIPQSRRRLVLIAGRGYSIPFPQRTHAKQADRKQRLKRWRTLRDVIGREPAPVTLSKAVKNGGPLKHRWHVVADLQPQVAARLAAAVPGQSWQGMPEALRPKCHQGEYIGFTNVYGRMAWDQTPVTITAGCLRPSKGRFGHPEKKRTTISVREAALIQTFPKRYKFPNDNMEIVCDMIGNAVPPVFGGIVGDQLRTAILARRKTLARAKSK